MYLYLVRFSGMLHYWLERYHARIRTLGSSLVPKMSVRIDSTAPKLMPTSLAMLRRSRLLSHITRVCTTLKKCVNLTLSSEINVRYLFYITKSKHRAKISFKMLFLTYMLAQLNGHCIERNNFAQHNKKARGQNYQNTWSISSDENNNIGLVYSCIM